VGVPILKVYLEGSFFRKIEEAPGLKVDILRTGRILSFEWKLREGIDD
jgi:hypothetical protein